MLLVVILKHLRLLSLLLVDLLHIKHRKHSLSSGSTCLLAQPLWCVSPWRTASVEISFSLLKKKNKKKTQLSLSLYVCDCECAIPAPHLHSGPGWAVMTANVSHVWCATCGIFIPGGIQTVTHACNIIGTTKVNGGWCGQQRSAMVPAAPEPPAFHHQPHSYHI